MNEDTKKAHKEFAKTLPKEYRNFVILGLKIAYSQGAQKVRSEVLKEMEKIVKRR